MKTKLNSTSLLKVFVLTLILSIPNVLIINSTNGQTTNQPTEKINEQKYPQKLVDAYVAKCTEGATDKKSEISPTQIKNYCQCTIDKIQSRLTLAEFIALSIQLEENQKIPPDFVEVIAQCIGDLYR